MSMIFLHNCNAVAGSTTKGCSNKHGIDCHLMDTSLGICKDAQLANLYCSKYCGLCGPTTSPLPTTTSSITSGLTTSSTSQLGSSRASGSTLPYTGTSVAATALSSSAVSSVQSSTILSRINSGRNISVVNTNKFGISLFTIDSSHVDIRTIICWTFFYIISN